jgi:hypothetical protein
MIINPIKMWLFLDSICPEEIPKNFREQDDLIRIIEQKLFTWLEDRCATQSQTSFLAVLEFVSDAWNFLEPCGDSDGDEKEAIRMCLLYVVLAKLFLRDSTRSMR